MFKAARTCLAALTAFAAGTFVSSTARADYPIFYQRYTADPGTLEHEGRLYLYASHDLDTQAGYEMYDITCISTDDMKNWTDHGECFNARTGSTWAQYSWAPTVVTRNGRFYMYYGNSGGSIGVAVADSPIGPFRDTRGRALIDGSTPGVNPPSGMWIFDPAAFIDDDGKAYLYFGGNGPSNIRVIQLGTDMVSTVGSAISMSAPRFFEAAWMHKLNGRYYFSYSTNWDLGAPTIDYMTSSSPTSGFQHRGTVLPQPPENSNNNHAGIFKFQNVWYVAYHNRTLARMDGVDPTYHRNLAVDRLNHNADGTIQQVTITTNGVPQIKSLNPYITVEAETMNRGQGIETEACSEGGRNVSSIENGDWVRVVGVDFGTGASSFQARVASATSGGSIQVRLGGTSGTLVGTCAVPGTGGWQTWTTVNCSVSGATGVKDVYLVFTGGSGSLFNVNWWRFVGGSSTTYALDVTKNGTGSGTVAGGPINCGSTCSASIASGTVVTLTATPAAGSTFGGWSGACTGSGSCVVTMTAARSVTATFNVPPVTGAVSINVGGAASGTFVADTGFSGGSTYSVTTVIDTSQLSGTIPAQAVLQTERYGEFTYTLGGFTAGSAQAVTLYFAEVYWSAAGQRTFNVAINGATVLSAFDIFVAAGGRARAISRSFNTTANASGQVVIQFTRAGGPDNPKVCGITVAPAGPTTQYALSVTKAGTGSGTVAGGPINCGGACSANIDSGTTVTLTASPANGSTFGGWSGACTGTGTCTVTMTAARAVTATFNQSGATFTNYRIVSVPSQRCLDINGASTANGTQAQIWDCNGQTNQSWTYDSSQNLVVYGNKCLQASGGGTSAGTAVVIGDCTGQASQRWNVNSSGTITNVQSGLCMDVNGGGTANGTKVILWSCHGGTNQQWNPRN